MTTPEVITVPMLFAAGDNHRALERLRDWCDATDTAARTQPLSTRDSEAVFLARAELVDEVRRLLPGVAS